VGFEPTTSAFERTKTVHALDRAATVAGERRFRTFYYRLLKGIFGLKKYVVTERGENTIMSSSIIYTQPIIIIMVIKAGHGSRAV
jgi:hypothetical protein